ncbi:MAG: MBL fold metallo-hydrolase [Pseudomonadota bacterium]
MIRRFLPVISVIGAFFLVFAWWLFIADSAAPEDAPGVLDIAQWRSLAAAGDPNERPQDIRFLEIGSDMAPAFAVQAGAFHGRVAMSYNALQLVTPSGTIIIGGGIDASTAERMQQDPDAATFSAENYSALVFAMLEAKTVLITHEHLDHVMAIARHPDPNALAPNLYLNAAQIEALPQFVTGSMPARYRTLEPRLSGEIEAIAPGVVVIPAPGHTAGSVMVFVTLQDGREILLIGDIAWSMSNIVDLTTRPILTQFAVFDPNEDRASVKRQIRALHDLSDAEPEVLILPSHDRDYINGLIASGALTVGFE